MTSHVYVVGSANMDVVATATTLPRPGETVLGTDLAYHAGGKGLNQAVAAARQGVPTALVGRLGQDGFGETLESFLHQEGVDVTNLKRVTDAPTGTAIIAVQSSSGENSIIVVPGANHRLTPQDVAALPFKTGDVVVGQFEIPLETLQAAFIHARSKGARTILNTAPAIPCGPDILALADIIVLNETELALYTGLDTPPTTAEAVTSTARALVQPDQTIVVTLGKAGAMAISLTDVVHVSGHAVKAVDTTGAGDCLTGVLAAHLALGLSLPQALRSANAAAALCVQRHGAAPSMPRQQELRGFLEASPATPEASLRL